MRTEEVVAASGFGTRLDMPDAPRCTKGSDPGGALGRLLDAPSGRRSVCQLLPATALSQSDHCLPVLPPAGGEIQRTQPQELAPNFLFCSGLRLTLPDSRLEHEHRLFRIGRVATLVLDLVRADLQDRTWLQSRGAIQLPAVQQRAVS